MNNKLSDTIEDLESRQVVDCSSKTVSQLYEDRDGVLISFTDGTFWCSEDLDCMGYGYSAEHSPVVLMGLLRVEALIEYRKKSEEEYRKRTQKAKIEQERLKIEQEKERIERERKDWEHIHEFINQPAVTTTDLRDV